MLERDQAAIAATLMQGPDHLPPDLFAGRTAAVLRGLKVHANSISHARLVALENSFPRTRLLLGTARFNQMSRDFVENGGASGRPLARIGETFAAFLRAGDDALAADVADVEDAWLCSYHAADAPALTLADLAALKEAALLALPVQQHPAARVVHLVTAAGPYLADPLSDACRTVLIVRPVAEVRIVGATLVDALALAIAEQPAPLGNLLALFAEQHADGAAAMAQFIDAGALMVEGQI